MVARQIQNAPSPAAVKKTSRKLLPKWSQELIHKRFNVMEDIMWEKARQCSQLNEKLLKSGKRKLVHNMESDPVWGFSEDGLGRNEMGKILIRVRECLLSSKSPSSYSLYITVPPSPAAPTQVKYSYASVVCQTKAVPVKHSKIHMVCVPSRTTCQSKQHNKVASKPVSKKPSLLVICNSNVRDLSAELNRLGASTIGYVFSGVTSNTTSKKTEGLHILNLTQYKPYFIFIMETLM